MIMTDFYPLLGGSEKNRQQAHSDCRSV